MRRVIFLMALFLGAFCSVSMAKPYYDELYGEVPSSSEKTSKKSEKNQEAKAISYYENVEGKGAVTYDLETEYYPGMFSELVDAAQTSKAETVNINVNVEPSWYGAGWNSGFAPASWYYGGWYDPWLNPWFNPWRGSYGRAGWYGYNYGFGFGVHFGGWYDPWFGGWYDPFFYPYYRPIVTPYQRVHTTYGNRGGVRTYAHNGADRTPTNRHPSVFDKKPSKPSNLNRSASHSADRSHNGRGETVKQTTQQFNNNGARSRSSSRSFSAPTHSAPTTIQRVPISRPSGGISRGAIRR